MPNEVLTIDKSIQFCAIVDKLGYVVASESRKNLEPLMTETNGRRQALQSAIRNFSRPSWEKKLGRVYYTATRYEKVIGATIPVSKDYFMLVAFDRDADNFDRVAMQGIIPLVEGRL